MTRTNAIMMYYPDKDGFLSLPGWVADHDRAPDFWHKPKTDWLEGECRTAGFYEQGERIKCCYRRNVGTDVLFCVFDGWPFNRFSTHLLQGNSWSRIGNGVKTMRAAQRRALSQRKAFLVMNEDARDCVDNIDVAVANKIWRDAA